MPMQLAYPILHILFYIAMWFAPADVDRVSITGPDGTFQLSRASGEWRFTSKEGAGTATIKDGKAILTANGKAEGIPVVSFIAAAIGHDWTKQSKITLQDQDTLEKTPDGFVLRIDDGKPGMKEYRITYHRGRLENKTISINVLGRVKQPGIFQVPPGSRTPLAITAAGGLTEKVDRLTCRILRGEAGTVPQIIEVPMEAILNPEANGPDLEDHDTLYLETRKEAGGKPEPKSITITVVADGALTLADQPCPHDQLADRLKKLVEQGAVSVTIQADPKTPYRHFASIIKACEDAGIQATSLSTALP